LKIFHTICAEEMLQSCLDQKPASFISQILAALEKWVQETCATVQDSAISEATFPNLCFGSLSALGYWAFKNS